MWLHVCFAQFLQKDRLKTIVIDRINRLAVDPFRATVPLTRVLPRIHYHQQVISNDWTAGWAQRTCLRREKRTRSRMKPCWPRLGKTLYAALSLSLSLSLLASSPFITRVDERLIDAAGSHPRSTDTNRNWKETGTFFRISACPSPSSSVHQIKENIHREYNQLVHCLLPRRCFPQMGFRFRCSLVRPFCGMIGRALWLELQR
jgi:hypothetical protein